MQQLPLGIRLRERASFETFVATNNAEACARLQALARAGGGRVWIWGARASGRTHLLQALVAQAASLGRRVGYLPLAEWPEADAAMLEGFNDFDLLCLDDLERLVGNATFERALFSLTRRFDEEGRALVVSADRPPAALEWTLPDIASRWSAAEVFQLTALDEAGQAEMLRRRAHARGLELPDETVRFLQRRFPRDVAALCELLDRIDVAALSAQRRLTVPFVRQALGEP